jgi:hypothetical protein
MDHLSARRQRLWEAMESCRTGADDLSDPQFADLAARLAEDSELRVQFQRLQEADGVIRATFVNLPIPAGLADRVSHRLAEAAPATSDRPTPLRKASQRFSRRRLLAGFTALSAAVALLAAVWIQTHLARHEMSPPLLEEAMDFFGKDSQPLGELVSRVAPPAEYPLSPDIAPNPDIRWRRVENFLGGSAVAYDLPTNAGRATLYVLERNVPDLPVFPPDPPILSTGGKSAADWQAGSILYVLVVEGDAWMYSNCLDHSHGPLT